MSPKERHHRAPGASEYLLKTYGISRSPKTLSKLRSVGGGPRYRKVSPREVLYPESGLDAWAQDLLKDKAVANTAQGRAFNPENFQPVVEKEDTDAPLTAA